MNWFILALAAPLCWSVANYLDKYLLSRSKESSEGGSGGLLILSALVSLFVVAGIYLAKGSTLYTLGSQEVGVLLMSGMFEALYILFYFWSLERESAATVISLAQFAPIMGLIFGFLILHEVPTGMQLAAVGLILLGTLAIILKKGERFTLRGSVFVLMLISTAFIGLYNTLFKLVGEQAPFWTAIFWQYTGIGMIGFLLYFGFPEYRKQTHQMLGRGGTTLALTVWAEIMNILALLATNAAVLLAPIALVLSVSSVQPIFVFLEGFLIVALFPKFMDASERPSLRAQYLLGIILVCAGGFLMYYQG